MKRLLLTLGILAVLLEHAAAVDQVFGAIAPANSLLARETIRQPFRLGRVVTFDYVYAFTGAGAAPLITGVRIFDNKKIQSPPATIAAGAIGTAAITIRFTSQRSFGIDSIVEVYGQ